MNRWFRCLAVSPVLLLVGCAESLIMNTGNSISGRVVDAGGHGISGQRIEVDKYRRSHGSGKSRWKEFTGEGDHRTVLVTDAEGRFRENFGMDQWSKPFFILPPLLSLLPPYEPPKPLYRIRDGSRAYGIVPDGRRVEARLLSADGKPSNAVDRSLSGDYRLRSGKWEVEVTLLRP